MNNDLRGARILVTRPVSQAENLCQIIEKEGGVAIRFPTLKIVALDEQAKATNPLPKLSNYQWLIFTSANAVNFALKAIGGKIEEFETAQIAAIGKATAEELKSAGLQVSLLPEQAFDSEALLAMSQLQQAKGQAILIVRGQGGREVLADGLRSRGANVGYWEVYRRVMPESDRSQVIDLLGQGKLDMVIVTSAEALQNLFAMLSGYQQRLAMIPLVVISERVGQLAAELGFERIAVTERPSDTAIVESAIAISNGRNK